MDLELLRANLVRTLVPIIVGALVSFLPVLNAHDEVATLAGFGVSAAYYSVFRIAETRYPWLGVFLGKRMVDHAAAANPIGEGPTTGSSREVGCAHSMASRQVTVNGSAPVPTVEGVSPRSDHGPVVSLDGHRLPGVTSVAWAPHPDGSTLLTLRLMEADLTITTTASHPTGRLPAGEGLETSAKQHVLDHATAPDP